MSIRIEFEPSREDWKEATWLYQRKREKRHSPLQWLMFVGYAATALGFLLLVKRPDGGGWVAPAALMVVGLFIPLRLNAIRHSQRDDAWSAHERLTQPAVWEFDDTALHTTTSQWQATLKWSAFNRWVEGPTVILLFSSATDFRVFPKRAFASAEQIAEFRRLLNSKIIPASTGGFPVTQLPSKSA
ncbi:MAG: hypothetical protein JWN40_4611 [Phycisphaerales bacterium]|nr:hypothetical protein [Phycisphaerales bacterium]